MPSPPDLSRLRSLLEEGTPGNWFLEDRQDATLMIRTQDADVAQVFTDDLNSNPQADAELIVQVVNSLPALLDVVEAAKNLGLETVCIAEPPCGGCRACEFQAALAALRQVPCRKSDTFGQWPLR